MDIANCDNPLGLDGFEFIEFSAPKRGVLEPAFVALGFVQIGRHRSKDVSLWRQGGINFIANYETDSPAGRFAAEHTPQFAEWDGGSGMQVKRLPKRWSAGPSQSRSRRPRWN